MILDDVSYFLHLSITRHILAHTSIKDEGVEWLHNDLGFNSNDALIEIQRARGAHVRFSTLEAQFFSHLNRPIQFDVDDKVKEYHMFYSIRYYLLYLVDTIIFNDKSATYVGVIYV